MAPLPVDDESCSGYTHEMLAAEDTIVSVVNIQNSTILASVLPLLQRLFKQWFGSTARPATLLENIDPACDAETTWRHVRTCVTKMHQLSTFLSKQTAVSITNTLTPVAYKHKVTLLRAITPHNSLGAGPQQTRDCFNPACRMSRISGSAHARENVQKLKHS
jgi:hypothetical protein